MGNYTTYVGLDVHARSIEASGVNVETGEEFSRSFRDCPTPEDVAEWLGTLPQPVLAGYESGCTGFTLARGLRASGLGSAAHRGPAAIVCVGCRGLSASALPHTDRGRVY